MLVQKALKNFSLLETCCFYLFSRTLHFLRGSLTLFLYFRLCDQVYLLPFIQRQSLLHLRIHRLLVSGNCLHWVGDFTVWFCFWEHLNDSKAGSNEDCYHDIKCRSEISTTAGLSVAGKPTPFAGTYLDGGQRITPASWCLHSIPLSIRHSVPRSRNSLGSLEETVPKNDVFVSIFSYNVIFSKFRRKEAVVCGLCS